MSEKSKKIVDRLMEYALGWAFWSGAAMFPLAIVSVVIGWEPTNTELFVLLPLLGAIPTAYYHGK